MTIKCPRCGKANQIVNQCRCDPDNLPTQLPPRLFIGVFPCGLSYADRWTEQHGDYKRLAFLPYSTLVLQVEPDCPPDLRTEIETDAATIIARRGQPFQVSACGQTVTLGHALPALP